MTVQNKPNVSSNLFSPVLSSREFSHVSLPVGSKASEAVDCEGSNWDEWSVQM